MSVAELLIKIAGQDTASAVLGNTQESVGKVGSAFSVAKGLIGGFGASAIGTLSDLAREGAADAASMMAVQVATENAGGAWEAAEGPLSAYIDRMRDTAAIADDKLKPALAGLIATTGDYEKSMGLASLAADLARGKNMDLKTAAELVGKVSEGNTAILTRYGITLDENATAEEALAELQKRFAGQAEAYGNTTQGQMEMIGLKIGDFREQIGQTMGPAMGFVGLLPGLSTGFTAFGSALGLVMPMLAPLGASIMGTVVPALGAMTAALGPVGLAILAIGAVVALFALAWSNNWFDIQGKTEAAMTFLGGAFENAKLLFGGIWDGIVGTIKTKVNSILGLINTVISAWNAFHLEIPGFSIELPSVDIPGIGRVGGGNLGWAGLRVDTPNMGLIPLLDQGGIVTRPTLALLAGNSRPEAVVPLDRGYGGTIINIYPQGSVLTAGNLVDEIHAGLLEKQRLNGDLGWRPT